MIEHKLKLKFDDSFNGVLFSTQGDTGRVFEVEVRDELDNAIDITGHKLEFYVGNDSKVTKVEASISGNKFIVKPVNEQFTKSGLNKAQFVLYDAQGLKVGSQIFDLHVEESIQNGATVGKNVIVDFNKINEALELIKGYEKTFKDSKNLDTTLSAHIDEGKKVNQELVSNTSAGRGLSENLKTSTASASEAYTKLEASRGSADTLNNNLKANIAQGNKTNANLQASISTAKNTQSTLQEKTAQGIDTNTKLGQSIKTGQDVVSKINAADKNLVTSVGNANTAKTNLDASVDKANTAKTNLDGSIDRAKTTKAKLDESSTKGSATDSELKETDTKANTSITTLQDLLSQSATAEQSLKDIIASGNLDKYVTEPKLQEALSKIKTLKKEVVEALPTTGQDDVIYLVKDSKGKANNVYLEYLWLDKWELIGSTEVDLSGYAKTSDIKPKVLDIEYYDYEVSGYRKYRGYIEEVLKNMFDDVSSFTHGMSNVLHHKADKEDVKTKLSEMIDDETHRLVTDSEKSTWNGKASKSDIKTSLSQLTSDSTHRTVTDEEKKRWNENSSIVEELSIIGLNLDSGIYKAVDYRKIDGELAYKSELIGEAPKYSKIKLSEYQGQQIKSTKTWNLFYDSNDFIYKKELERS
jgi:hypothetical protein